jgi:hypothetical protein
VATTDLTVGRNVWLERVAPFGAFIWVIWLLVGFFTSDDYDDTPASLVAYAEGDEANIIGMLVLAIATPLLLGTFFAGLLSRFAAVEPMLRAMVVIGGTVFISLMTVAMILWSAPLVDDDFNEQTAPSYMILDDAGWVMIGTAGVGMAVAIFGASLAAMRHRWIPLWAGVVSLVLGVLALATVAAVGIFAWCAWLLAAGVVLLLGARSRREVGER